MRRKERSARVCQFSGCDVIIPAEAHALRLYCSQRCLRRHHERNTRFRVFGGTVNDYDRLFMEQEGRCAICGGTSPGRADVTNFAFDHDHVSGRKRGLLCYLCNVGLGSFQDDPALLQAAIRYLGHHSADGIETPEAGSTDGALKPLVREGR